MSTSSRCWPGGPLGLYRGAQRTGDRAVPGTVWRQSPAAEPEAALLEREYDELTREVELPQFVYAPVEAGQVLGEIRLLSGDKVVWQSALVADSDVPALTRERQGILEFIGSLLGQ